MGYTVAHNKPYAGGFITEHYGRPARGLHALQIEVNRGLYMNERTLQKSAGFDALAEDLSRFSADLMAMPDYHFLGPAARRRVNRHQPCAARLGKKRPHRLPTRSKSREETPKEGMDRRTCPNSRLLCDAQMSTVPKAFLIHTYVEN